MVRIKALASACLAFFSKASPTNRVALIASSLALIFFMVLIFGRIELEKEKAKTALQETKELAELKNHQDSPANEVLALANEILVAIRSKHGVVIKEQLLPATMSGTRGWVQEVELEQLNRDVLTELFEVEAGKRGFELKEEKLFADNGGGQLKIFYFSFHKEGQPEISFKLFSMRETQYDETGFEATHLPVVAEEIGQQKQMLLIIDDFGYDFEKAKRFTELDPNLTFAVLPLLDYSAQIVEYLKERQFYYMLHMPMEPDGWPRNDPGPGFLSVDDNSQDITLKVQVALDSLGGAPGINNHMGSIFTQSSEEMDALFAFLSKKHIFFIDSKTSPGRGNRIIAQKYNIPFAERDVFLDNTVNEQEIKKQFSRALNLLNRKGRVIVIGHPFEETYNILKDEIPRLEEAGVKLIRPDEYFSL